MKQAWKIIKKSLKSWTIFICHYISHDWKVIIIFDITIWILTIVYNKLQFSSRPYVSITILTNFDKWVINFS